MDSSLGHIVSWIGAAMFLGSFAALLVIFVLSVINARPGYRWLDVLRMRAGSRKPRWLHDIYARLWGHEVRRPDEVLTDRGLAYWRWNRYAEMVAVLGVVVIILGDALGS